MQKIVIKPEKLYTKSEYAKAYNISRPTINKKIESKELTSVKIKGAILIVAA
jgi:DNA-binding XRE family transcriptional regulator